MLCGEWSLVKAERDRVTAVSLRCRAWTCDLCEPDRKARLMAFALSGNPTTFITLTVRPRAGQSPTQRAHALADAWRVIVRRARKHYGYKKIDYLAVLEATKRGEPHLHVLSRVPWIDQGWLSRQAKALLGAPVVDIRRCAPGRIIAAYVSKYVGKAPHRFGTCKRYWSTRTWEEGDRPETGRAGRDRHGWEIVKSSLADLLHAARADGFIVTLADDVLTALWRHDSTGPPWWAVAR